MQTLHTAPRLLIIPGLNDSGPTHWQSWLQARHAGARRVVQSDWQTPDLDVWSAAIDQTLARAGADGAAWIAVAHSFGCLALAEHLTRRPRSPLRAALLVAPADPARFGLEARLSHGRLPLPSTLVASDTDPWMSAASSRLWAARWGSAWLTLGDAGHINVEAGFGPLPLAQRWVAAMTARLAAERRPERAALAEWSFAL